jgi:hypothetical protein
MMTAMLFILRRYAFGIIPFPNLYVTWFEHNNPANIIKICNGTSPKAAVYHRFKTSLSKSRYRFLHPGNTLLA